MKITLDQFYAALRDCVKFYPETEPRCLQLRGFRVVANDGISEITTDNMGATACDDGKPYFFSKEWELKGKKAGAVIGSLPVLTAFERIGDVETPFDVAQKRTKEIAITVWDKYNQAKCGGPNCSGCDARTINEIFRDTEILLMNALYYIGGLVLATTTTDPKPRLYHQGFLEAMKNEGVIDEYTKVGYLKNTLQPQGKKFQIYRQESISHFMYGTTVVLEIRADACVQPEFNFTNISKAVMAQEAQCC